MINSLEDLMLTMWGFVPSRVLQISIKYSIIDIIHTKGVITTQELAENLKWSNRPTKSIMNVLQSIGLVIKIPIDKWTLSNISKKWLTKDSSYYLGDFIQRSSLLEKSYDKIDLVAKNDHPNHEMFVETINAFGKQEEITKKFAYSMNAMSLEFAHLVAEHVPLDLTNNSCLLDVGCGIGTISIAISQKWKDIKIDMFDLPNVTALAKNEVNKIKPSLNIKIHESDWAQWDWTKYYNIVVLSQVLHELDLSGASWLLKKATDCLAQGGIILIVGIGFQHKKTNNLLFQIFDLNMKLEIGGDNTTLNWILDECNKNQTFLNKVVSMKGGRTLYIIKKN